MEQDQMKYIINILKNVEPCEIKEKYINYIDKISIPIIEGILKYKSDSGSDMKALSCMFETIMLSSGFKNPLKGIYDISDSDKQWIKEINLINKSSTSGYIYITKIFSDDI